ncbi:MAG: hypothetical protein JKY25_02760 [Robiginitomaculum sp.]|nr:hypothetical protein [Robiginitomaculum sp.]
MRIYSVVSLTISGVLMMGVGTVALAGSPSVNCNKVANIGPNAGLGAGLSVAARPVIGCSANNVIRHAGSAGPLAPVNTYNRVPYGYLKTFKYKNSPDVNVMRIHSRAPLVRLNNAPTGFTNAGVTNVGLTNRCAPAPTRYCRSSGARLPAFTAPVVPRPIFARAPLPSMRLPAAPVYKMRPRPVMSAPRGGNILGYVSGGTRTYQPEGGGRYWEKVSGPTTVGGLRATQILCRRETPKPAPVTVNIVRPVIGVPHAVPTPFAVPMQPVRPVCGAAPTPLMGRAMGPRLAPRLVPRQLPRQAPVLAGGRWTY